MAKEVRLPQFGQTMEEGTIVNCLVKAGDEVKKGDCIFEIETDKATLEMESSTDGFVKHILIEVGQTIPVGEPLMILGQKDEEVPQSFIDSLKSGVPAAATAEAAPAAPAAEQVEPQAEPTKPAGKVKASPRAKKLAGELNVDLARVSGTGPVGKITEEDVKKAAAAKPAKPAGPPAAEIKLGQTIPVSKLQRITTQKMLQSKREIPCFYLTVKTDVTDLIKLRERLNSTSEVGTPFFESRKMGTLKISYHDFIMRAVAMGLEKFPIMTGQLAGDTIQLAESIGIGLAVSVPDGLVAPIVNNVNKKDVAQIARDSQALIEKARNNKLAPADLEGGCITVSNLGAFGIESFIPVVVPGQCSILGIGQISSTFVLENGNIILRRFMNMTLSVDHKVANGAYAAQFLDYVKKLLEDTSTFE